jgi:hypothetical protein
MSAQNKKAPLQAGLSLLIGAFYFFFFVAFFFLAGAFFVGIINSPPILISLYELSLTSFG